MSKNSSSSQEGTVTENLNIAHVWNSSLENNKFELLALSGDRGTECWAGSQIPTPFNYGS